MAYEKYIKRGGKLYGPYIYHSRRVDGKVVSEYHGQVKKDYRKFIFITLGVLFLIGMVYFFSSFQKGLTGHSVLNLDADYTEGEILSGKIKISLQSGELLPANSKIVFDNNNNKLEYTLSEFVSETPIQGEFYIDGSSLSGEGEGYGISGEKEIYPLVKFVLEIGEPLDESNTFNIIEIGGEVSAEEDFTYILEEGYEVQLKSKSVKTDTQNLSDSSIKMEVEGNEVTVTTSYSETEEGFGEDYLGEEYKDIIIDISELGLIFEPGNLKLSVLDSENKEELISLTTVLGEEQTSEETTTEPEKPSLPTLSESEEPEPISSENQATNETGRIVIIPSLTLDLTTEERNILIREFGENISVKVTEAIEKTGWITIRHEIGNYWVENSYVSDLNRETINSFVERDKIKWLKDIALSLSQNENPEKNLDEFLGEHAV